MLKWMCVFKKNPFGGVVYCSLLYQDLQANHLKLDLTSESRLRPLCSFQAPTCRFPADGVMCSMKIMWGFGWLNHSRVPRADVLRSTCSQSWPNMQTLPTAVTHPSMPGVDDTLVKAKKTSSWVVWKELILTDRDPRSYLDFFSLSALYVPEEMGKWGLRLNNWQPWTWTLPSVTLGSALLP